MDFVGEKAKVYLLSALSDMLMIFLNLTFRIAVQSKCYESEKGTNGDRIDSFLHSRSVER